MLQYTVIDPAKQTVTGTIEKEVLEKISPELADLKTPLTGAQLQLIEQFYPQILDVIPENVCAFLDKKVIQYAVINPSGKKVTEIINEPVLLDNGNDLLNELIRGIKYEQLQLYLPALLAITSKKNILVPILTLHFSVGDKNLQ